MNISIVRSRNGKPAIYWPGVILATAIVTAVYSIGVVAFSLAVGWFSPLSFIILPVLIGSVVGRSVYLGLYPPV